jgi:hypothetical protein
MEGFPKTGNKVGADKTKLEQERGMGVKRRIEGERSSDGVGNTTDEAVSMGLESRTNKIVVGALVGR